MGMFIRVTVDQAILEKTPGLAKQLVEVCPVKIFAPSGGAGVKVVEDNEDECTLCELCTKASAGVKVEKLYES